MSITAMRQALEALEYEASRGNDDAYRIQREALRTAIAEADRKKPVAWATDLHFDADTEIIPAKQKGRLGTDGMPVPLFSGPPAAQRQWVGLTEAEINEWDYDTRDVVMDIEKLLREKNHG
jgi:hypothetical protein